MISSNNTLPLINVDVPVTFRDHPGVMSAVYYVPINKCNLDCYYCHNRKHYNKGEAEFLTYRQFETQLRNFKILGVELIIISGGEPLLFDIYHISDIVHKHGLKIRVDTNGMLVNRIKDIIQYVDGFAIDIKIPLTIQLTKDRLLRYSKILFGNDSLDFRVKSYQELVLQSIKEISRYITSLPYTLTRTVKVPELNEEDLDYIKKLSSAYCLYHMELDYIKV